VLLLFLCLLLAFAYTRVCCFAIAAVAGGAGDTDTTMNAKSRRVRYADSSSARGDSHRLLVQREEAPAGAATEHCHGRRNNSMWICNNTRIDWCRWRTKTINQLRTRNDNARNQRRSPRAFGVKVNDWTAGSAATRFSHSNGHLRRFGSQRRPKATVPPAADFYPDENWLDKMTKSGTGHFQ